MQTSTDFAAVASSALGAAVTVGGVLWYGIRQTFRAELLQQEIRLKEWINGSFMRAAVVNEKLNALDHRIAHVEDIAEGN